MDVLSEVLRVIRLSGAVHLRAEFTCPWSILSSPRGLAGRLKLGTDSLTAFHVCVEGSCFARVDNLPAVRIEAGDVIIFPRREDHAMGSDLAITPVPMRDIYPHPSTERVADLKHGGPGEAARFICGYLHSDQQFGPLFESLPPVLCVRSRNGSVAFETVSDAGSHLHSVSQQHEAEWWQASLRYLVSEAKLPGPGNRAVLARLAESLFVQALRWQARYTADGCHGWLAGLHDPQVGRVLNLLHALPHRPWTVDELAKEAAISRATLAKRFVELVGQSPIQYLAGWRMHLARHLLQEGALGIGEIAGRVGYESEAAFNRAFRRLVGSPPATWRQVNNSPTQRNNLPTQRIEASS
jgi:AraC family transcriptional regulator, alkane utilization regulator